MNSSLKIALLSTVFITANLAANAQAPDSVKTETTINVAPETVVIADTTLPPPTSFSSSGRETETIRIYSGSHEGNNIIRTVEVPLPVDGDKRNPY
ncbi:MAG: hypothetical protein ABI772_11465 [Bacteroidota bacterium]